MPTLLPAHAPTLLPSHTQPSPIAHGPTAAHPGTEISGSQGRITLTASGFDQRLCDLAEQDKRLASQQRRARLGFWLIVVVFAVSLTSASAVALLTG